jgi:uncharacterized protein with HEPN domain
MSKRHFTLYLIDALVALERIEFLTKGFACGDDFRKNSLCYHAVLKFFEIVGEATKLFMNEPSLELVKESSWQTVIAFRNIIVHEYFGVDYNAVLKIAQHNVPALRKNFEKVCFELKDYPRMREVIEDAKTDLIKAWEKESAEYLQKFHKKLYSN